MMFCVKCGKHISDESKFCSFCGSKVDSEVYNNQILLDAQKKAEQQISKESTPEKNYNSYLIVLIFIIVLYITLRGVI